jgi:hypothetical protein
MQQAGTYEYYLATVEKAWADNANFNWRIKIKASTLLPLTTTSYEK